MRPRLQRPPRLRLRLQGMEEEEVVAEEEEVEVEVAAHAVKCGRMQARAMAASPTLPRCIFHTPIDPV